MSSNSVVSVGLL